MFVAFGLSVKLKCSVHLAVSAQKPPSSCVDRKIIELFIGGNVK